MAKGINKPRKVDLKVQVELVDAPEKEKRQKLAAYAFTKGGKLLATRVLDAQGEATLSVPGGDEQAAVCVFAGPVVDDPNVEELLRRGAEVRRLRVSAKDADMLVQISVLPPIWGCWLKSACMVRGTLLKRVVSGGVTMDLPVVNATVEVYEVDPLIIVIPKLPDWIIDRFRRIVVGPWPHPPLPDPPDPGPFPIDRYMAPPRPGPGPGPAWGSDPVPLSVRRAMRGLSETAPAMDQVTAQAFQEFAQNSDLKLIAQTGGDLQFRDALIKYPQLVKPLLCCLFPMFVTKKKVASAETDECGKFQTLFFRGCYNTDQPDLYFTARQRHFGWFEPTIYAPTPVACHTYWDYACGTSVTLITASPWAIAGPPCQPVVAGDNWVLFTAIGNTSLKYIFGGGAAGATAVNLGLRANGAPWGGVLRPRLDFDNSLRDSLGVKYYQLSWRKGTSGDWTPMTADINRHYAHMVGSHLVLEAYKLGPNHMEVAGDQLELYEIPPSLPPIGQWSVANAVLDTENGEFNSVAHSSGLTFEEDGDPTPGTADDSGLYQFKLDLYDSTGHLVNLAAQGIDYYVPDNVDLAGTIHTVKANTVTQPGGGSLVSGDSLVLTLHVDNNHCWAGLGAPYHADRHHRAVLRDGPLLRRRVGDHAIRGLPSTRVRDSQLDDPSQRDSDPADHHRRCGQLHRRPDRGRHDEYRHAYGVRRHGLHDGGLRRALGGIRHGQRRMGHLVALRQRRQPRLRTDALGLGAPSTQVNVQMARDRARSRARKGGLDVLHRPQAPRRTHDGCALSHRNVEAAVDPRRGGDPGHPVLPLRRAPHRSSRPGYSLNFIIPADLMCGNLKLTATVTSPAGSSDQYELHINVTLRQTLNVRGIMVGYNGPASLAAGAPNLTLAAPTLTDLQTTGAWTLLTYPVRSEATFGNAGTITWNLPLTDAPSCNGCCTPNWVALNSAVQAQKVADGNRTDVLYYGLMAAGVPMGPVVGCNSSGVSTGSNGAQETMAHELGHACGLPHSPCGVGGDPAFPVYEPYDTGGIAHAFIGEYGLDIGDGTIIPPASFKDWMSYCGPRWVSLYNYGKLLHNTHLDPEIVCEDHPWWHKNTSSTSSPGRPNPYPSWNGGSP